MQQPELGIKINELRKAHGWSQEDLALEANINVRSVQRIESGEVKPRLSTLKNLSDLLEYDLLEKESQEANLWLMVMHLSCMFPVVVVPLFIWIWRRNDDSRINEHGPVLINFQLSLIIYMFIGGLLSLIGIGLILLPLFSIWLFFITLINTIKVAIGQQYNYPLSMKIIKL